ncbi:methionine aminopeptidase 1D, mitochondrial-like [Chironomus tepperi]|uniref:methionine aminopeptidase 1D, mitochondrial-like n=1 Tax=Chironomus tepperi TaxID=113505 RepID=UPI00391EE7FC
MFSSRIFIRSFFFKRNKFADAPNVIRELGKVSKDSYSVPDCIQKPPYYHVLNKQAATVGQIEIKNEKQIEGMRRSCRLAARMLNMCEDVVKPGTTTDEIDKFVFNNIISSNAYPSPLRYCGFPKSICTSVNNIACHGIPDDRPLMDGDIINIDITVFYEGFHGDTSRTFLVGNVNESGRYLVEHNQKALMKAIKICGPGQCFNEIGKEISKYAKEVKLSNVRAFIGHGIGDFFHGPPEVYHFENTINMELMQPGMTFTIEPIYSEGSDELELWEDKWTTSTIDGSRTSQFEHTILITDHGCEILTVAE